MFDIQKQGWALVKINGKFGFIDRSGAEVISPKYDYIQPFDIIRSGWAKVKLDGK